MSEREPQSRDELLGEPIMRADGFVFSLSKRTLSGGQELIGISVQAPDTDPDESVWIGHFINEVRRAGGGSEAMGAIVLGRLYVNLSPEVLNGFIREDADVLKRPTYPELQVR